VLNFNAFIDRRRRRDYGSSVSQEVKRLYSIHTHFTPFLPVRVRLTRGANLSRFPRLPPPPPSRHRPPPPPASLSHSVVLLRAGTSQGRDLI